MTQRSAPPLTGLGILLLPVTPPDFIKQQGLPARQPPNFTADCGSNSAPVQWGLEQHAAAE